MYMNMNSKNATFLNTLLHVDKLGICKPDTEVICLSILIIIQINNYLGWGRENCCFFLLSITRIFVVSV